MNNTKLFGYRSITYLSLFWWAMVGLAHNHYGSKDVFTKSPHCWFVESFLFSLPQKKIANTKLTKKPVRLSSLMSPQMSSTVNNISKAQLSRTDRLLQRRRRRKERRREISSSDVEMKFLGVKTLSSSTVSFSKSDNGNNICSLLNNFFALEENRNLLFPANEAKSLQHAPTPEQLETWSQQAELGGAEGPIFLTWENTDGQEVILVNDETIEQKIFQIKAPLQMPGLKIISESTIGMKLLLGPRMGRDDISLSLPEYQFSLLDSKIVADGPAPVVWLFQKLMKYRDSTSSFTRVRAKKKHDTTLNEIIFVTEARLETIIRLPSKVLKVLPNVNISKFERQGSDAIQKLLENDLEPALNGFCEAFRKYSKSYLQKQTKSITKR